MTPHHEDGVYLNLPHARYLGDSALGYSAMKLLASSPVEWWWDSPWNPLRPPEKEKKAFERGEAAHVAFLDGLGVYSDAYGIRPTRKTHPDLAATVDDLKALCAAHGLPTTAKVKQDLLDRLEGAGLGDQTLASVEAAFEASGKLPIEEEDDAVIRLVHRMAFRSREEMGLGDEHATLSDAFAGGLHEVSVFWTDENGIRQRARFDKLKANVTIDLKTITDWRRGDFKRSLLRECVIRGYVIQAVHYDEARRQMQKAVDEGRIFGGSTDELERLREIASSAQWKWAWVFAKLDGAPQLRVVIPDREGPQYKRAQIVRQEALSAFVRYREAFGMERQWCDTNIIWQPEDADWPAWSLSDD